ncbi:MAG TPA: MFS transporter [Gemmatimonadaceae bacterium]|nr:MFS transporter [Gemmatimonadaceae bacterium]
MSASPSPVRAPLVERGSWALYDFANTIFSMNVATLYFSVWLIADLGASNTVYALGNGISSLLVVISVPVLGALSDARRRRKPWVVGFTVAACIACAAIGVFGQKTLPVIGEGVIAAAPPGSWHPTIGTFGWVLLAFIVANYCYQAAQPFYNAMLPELVPPEEQGRLSGIGTAVGYVGTIVGLLLVVPFFNGAFPLIGAISDSALDVLRSIVPFTSHAGRVSTFVPTAILFFLFSLPLFLLCRDRHPRAGRIEWRQTFANVGHTLRDARDHKGALPFIAASFLYQDAIGTIVSFMALYAVKAMGFAKGAETTLFLVLTVPAIFGSYAAGRLVDRFGPRRTLVLSIIAWIALLVAMIIVPTQRSFWVVGGFIGLIFGAVPTAERPMLLALVPEEEAGRFFSLMLLSSRAAAIAGPWVWAVTVDQLEPTQGTGFAYRAAVVTVALMFAASLLLMRHVPDRRAGDTIASAA